MSKEKLPSTTRPSVPAPMGVPVEVPDEAGSGDAANRADFDFGSGGNGTHPHRGEEHPDDRRRRKEAGY